MNVPVETEVWELYGRWLWICPDCYIGETATRAEAIAGGAAHIRDHHAPAEESA